LKKIIAAQIGTRPEKIRLQKWYQIFKDHVTLDDYEIHDGMGIELYCIFIQQLYINDNVKLLYFLNLTCSDN